MKVLVTGASGFVGTRLLHHLLDNDDEVVATLQPGHELTEDLAGRVTSCALDLYDAEAVREVLRQHECDVIIHLAALSDVAASWKDIADCYRVNVEGTEALLRAAEDRTRLVLASSAEVYGKVTPAQLPLREEAPRAPSTPYAMSKACAELLALRHGARVVRSFNLVGPGQSPRFAISSFAHQLHAIRARGEEPVLHVGNLDSKRDFLHVDDGAAAYRLIAHAGEDSGTYNLATGRPRRVAEVLGQLIAVTGMEVRIEVDPERLRPSDVPAMAGDPARLQQLGWRPERTLNDALRDLWNSLDEECLPGSLDG